jgi:hypothetical protein
LPLLPTIEQPDSISLLACDLKWPSEKNSGVEIHIANKDCKSIYQYKKTTIRLKEQTSRREVLKAAYD